MSAGLDARDTAHGLVDAALAAGGRDNVTTIVLDVVDAPTEFEFHSTAPRSGGRTV
jgi:protein phosphatase